MKVSFSEWVSQLFRFFFISLINIISDMGFQLILKKATLQPLLSVSSNVSILVETPHPNTQPPVSWKMIVDALDQTQSAIYKKFPSV